jgi:uncharacterized membrane protein
MLNKFKRQFFSGLIIFLPLSLSIYFFHLLFLITSQWLHPVILKQDWVVLPRAAVRPLSFLFSIGFIWGLGLIASNYFGKRLVSWLEAGIRYIPFFRGMYEAIQKMTEALFGAQSMFQSVVLVEYPRKGVHSFGFVTSRLSGKIFNSSEPYVGLFVPTVPNPTSGLLIYVPESETIPLRLTIEEAAKILVSHGFVTLPDDVVKKG